MSSPTVPQESVARRMARAELGLKVLKITPTDKLLRLISRPYRKADQSSGQTMEAALLELLAMEAYLGPYLIDNEPDAA